VLEMKKKRVFVKICGLDGGISVADPKYYENLEEFAREDLAQEFSEEIANETDLFECEPYEIDKEVLETELEHRVSNFKVIRAITYSATNPNEYQEIEVLL